VGGGRPQLKKDALKKWGPISECAWDFFSFSHDQARARTDRCGEDRLAGISDDRQTFETATAGRS